jgi:energy-converting hydrogenase Eha subunit G
MDDERKSAIVLLYAADYLFYRHIDPDVEWVENIRCIEWSVEWALKMVAVASHYYTPPAWSPAGVLAGAKDLRYAGRQTGLT